MERMKIAICMKEGEYLKRLSGCLMNHYRTCLEIHIFTEEKQIGEIAAEEYHGFLIGDFSPEAPELTHIPREKILYLGEPGPETAEELQLVTISRYEEVPRIVDAIGILVGNTENFFKTGGDKHRSCKRLGVYSLNAAELQLPFVMLLCNVLAEKQRVLVIDLQENSGFGSLGETDSRNLDEMHLRTEQNSGMEDIMSMADSKKYTKARLISAIKHYRQWDYIYPARNSECIGEGDYGLYQSMLQIIEKELNYDVIVLNFGTRFQGFFRVLSECRECFLLSEGTKKDWREKSFYEEIQKREKDSFSNNFVRIEMSEGPGVIVSAERLSDQWLWNEQGDLLRKLLGRESTGG